MKRAWTFRGRVFDSLAELVGVWNTEHPGVLPAKVGNVEQNIRNWQRRHPGIPLSDAAIENALTPRSATHAIVYQGRTYAGPSSLYAVLQPVAEVPFKSFFAALDRWRRRNPLTPYSDDLLEGFAKRCRPLCSADGRHVGPLKHAWELLTHPKLSWSRVTQKIIEFRRMHRREPTAEEMRVLSVPVLDATHERRTIPR